MPPATLARLVAVNGQPVERCLITVTPLVNHEQPGAIGNILDEGTERYAVLHRRVDLAVRSALRVVRIDEVGDVEYDHTLAHRLTIPRGSDVR